MKISEKLKMIIKCALDMKTKEVSTDKGTLYFDAEILKEGVEVFVKENDELLAASDGDYQTDIDIISIAEGKVISITPIEKEEEEKEEDVEIDANTDEPAEEPIEETDETDEKVDVDNELATIKTQVDGLVESITNLTNNLSALQGVYEELKERLDKIEKEPATDPVEDEVEEPKSRMAYLKKK